MLAIQPYNHEMTGQRQRALLEMVGDLWQRLSGRRRKQFFILLGLMLLASIAEVFSVAAVLPFLGVLTAPDRVLAHPYAQPFLKLLSIENAHQLLFAVAVSFCIAALLSGFIRLLLLHVTTKFSFAVGIDLSQEVYRRTLYQPYPIHISRNSSEVISGILNKTGTLARFVIVPLLTLVSSAILLTTVMLGLLAIDPTVAITAFLAFGAIYSAISLLTKRSLRRNSQIISTESDRVVKALQEGLGGIRDVLIDGTQEVYCKIYERADRALMIAQSHNTFIGNSPKFLIETFGMILIAVLAYAMSLRDGGLGTAIPVLGTIALGAQRLLPILQQAYYSLVSIRGSEASMRDVLYLMDQPLPPHAGSTVSAPVKFNHELNLLNVGFRYNGDGPQILRAVDLKLEKSKRYGFIGATGSGKTTLLDIVMGLLSPTEGFLTVDGVAIDASNERAWQSHIAHVPQSIFLSDGSIQENIAFGVPADQVDAGRLHEAARQAQLSDLIEAWPEKYATSVGERGVRLSGGQRQRIGIARALYKRASVIIFDEATSALDNETEQALMKAINSLDRGLTILIIAHRLTTLKDCDEIIEVVDGGIKRVGQYDSLVVNA